MSLETGKAEMSESTAQARGRRQTKVGTVVSDKMDKTVVVAVEKVITHPLYHRFAKRTSKFYAHDEQNECKVGDEVIIVSDRPISRLKRWRVQRVVKAGERG